LKNAWGRFFNRDFLLGIAISSLTLLSVALIPLVGSIVIILSPLPILFYYTKLGRVMGLAVFGLSLGIVVSLLSMVSPEKIFPLFFLIGLTGVFLSEALKQEWSIEKTVIIPLFAVMAVGAGLLTYHSFQSGQPPWQFINAYIHNSIQENIRIYKELDISSDQINLIRDNAQQIARFLTWTFPAIVAASTGICLWLNILAARPFFRKDGMHYPDFGDLTHWKAPEKIIWLLIAGGGTLLVPQDFVKLIGANILIVCLFIYLAEGISIIGFFLKVKKVPVIFQVMLYFLILVQQYLLLIVVALGLFDLWADFRKFIRPAADPGV
jgi:uncharacterized protein YybS (DUF2232 family)